MTEFIWFFVIAHLGFTPVGMVHQRTEVHQFSSRAACEEVRSSHETDVPGMYDVAVRSGCFPHEVPSGGEK